MSAEPASVLALDRHVTRRVTIASKTLVVVDHLFSADAVRSLFAFLERLPYTLNDTDTEETAYARHWKSEFPLAQALGTRYSGTACRLRATCSRPKH